MVIKLKLQTSAKPEASPCWLIPLKCLQAQGHCGFSCVAFDGLWFDEILSYCLMMSEYVRNCILPWSYCLMSLHVPVSNQHLWLLVSTQRWFEFGFDIHYWSFLYCWPRWRSTLNSATLLVFKLLSSDCFALLVSMIKSHRLLLHLPTVLKLEPTTYTHICQTLVCSQQRESKQVQKKLSPSANSANEREHNFSTFVWNFLRGLNLNLSAIWIC